MGLLCQFPPLPPTGTKEPCSMPCELQAVSLEQPLSERGSLLAPIFSLASPAPRLLAVRGLALIWRKLTRICRAIVK